MEVTKQNINKFNKAYSNDNMIVLVYADWCGACERFKPTWQNFTENFHKDKNSKNVKIFQLEDSQINSNKRNKVIKKISAQFQGFPSVFYINKNENIDTLIGSDKTNRQLKIKMNKFFEFNKK